MAVIGIILPLLALSIKAEIINTRTYWNKTFINSGVNPLVVGVTEPSRTVVECSVRCSQGSLYKSFYYSNNLHVCYCNVVLDGAASTTTVNTGVTYGVKRELSQGRDCLELYQQGVISNGVYMISPVGGVPVAAWCDMTGGGWTVIQRRQDGSENFYRLWTDYVNGFGNRSGEYWLGLDNIHLLTQNASTLRIELESFSAATAAANYSAFSVGSAGTNYILSVSGFTGDCTERLAYHNGMMFSTQDVDNDLYGSSCAVMTTGAWWFNNCDYCHLNGVYNSSVFWDSCVAPLKKTVMKIKRII